MVGSLSRRHLLGLAGFAGIVIALLSFPHSAAAAPVYDIIDYPAFENGWHISGSITTDGTLGDVLTATNIVSWNWTITDPANDMFSIANGSIKSLKGGNLDATPQFLSISDSGDILTLGDNPGSTGPEFLRWENVSGGSEMLIEVQLSSEQPMFWHIPTTTFQVAGPPAGGAAPEPSTLALFSGFGTLGMLGGWRKRRRAVRKIGD